MTDQSKGKTERNYTFYGNCEVFTSEMTIELGEINKAIEINIEIPLTWELENLFLGRDELQ